MKACKRSGFTLTELPAVSKRGFTLTELLVVIGIMALIMLLALPRFSDIGRGSKMRAALSELRSTLGLARQWAIANRETIYVFFPDEQSTLFSGLPATEYPKALRSYAVYSRTRGYIKDWTYLPAGIFFVDHYNSVNMLTDTRLGSTEDNWNAFRQPTLQQWPFPYSDSGIKTINTLEFKPDGTSGIGFNPYEIFLGEGVELEGTAGKVKNIAWKKQATGNANTIWSILINPLTGSTKIQDYSGI